MDTCERFLRRQRDWIRAVLNGDYDSPSVIEGLVAPGGIEALNKAEQKYEELLKCCPKHLREYRERRRREAADSILSRLPSLPRGARRKDWLAREIDALGKSGLSQSKIARELNKRHPDLRDRKGNRRPVTSEVVRWHLREQRRKVPPEKN